MPRYRTDILQEILRHESRIQQFQCNISVELANSLPDPSSLAPAEKLRPDMFYQVFRHLKAPSLKACREVCSTWRRNIYINTKLMKSLTFDVNNSNVHIFMESQLAAQVKSIRLQEPLLDSDEFLKDFFRKLGTTVEQIIIDLRIENACVEDLMDTFFSIILRFCTKLDSLIITNESNHYDFIKNVARDVRNRSTLLNIQNLSITLRSAYLNDVKQLVLSLPNLRCLEFNCKAFGFHYFSSDFDTSESEGEEDFVRQERIPDIIFDHLMTYNGKLQEISLERISGLDSKIITKFLLSVGKYYPNVNIKCTANLNDLINFEETEELQVNGNTCLDINAGILKLHRRQIQTIDTSRIRYCTNLHSLNIEIYTEQHIPSVKLGFITQLSKLTYLRIKDFGLRIENQVENRIKSARIFKTVMPALTTLDFDGEGIGLDLFSFHLRFPNLTKLAIRNFSGYIMKDFIYKLSSLNNLKKLTLENLEKLKVCHFTNICDFVVEENNEIIRIPAITCFKSLRHLHLVNSPSFMPSNYSRLSNVLKLCKQLKKITLCDSFTRRMFIGFDCDGFNVKDLPRCHAEEKHSNISRNRFEFKRFFR